MSITLNPPVRTDFTIAFSTLSSSEFRGDPRYVPSPVDDRLRSESKGERK